MHGSNFSRLWVQLSCSLVPRIRGIILALGGFETWSSRFSLVSMMCVCPIQQFHDLTRRTTRAAGIVDEVLPKEKVLARSVEVLKKKYLSAWDTSRITIKKVAASSALLSWAHSFSLAPPPPPHLKPYCPVLCTRFTLSPHHHHHRNHYHCTSNYI